MLAGSANAGVQNSTTAIAITMANVAQLFPILICDLPAYAQLVSSVLASRRKQRPWGAAVLNGCAHAGHTSRASAPWSRPGPRSKLAPRGPTHPETLKNGR